MVPSEVSRESKIAEKTVVEANGHAFTDVRLAHRRDIHHARRLVNSQLDELEQQTDPTTLGLMLHLGEVMAEPDEKIGRDKLNELYQAIISLPERTKTMKLLFESLQKLVDMERSAFSMDKEAPGESAFTKVRKMINTSGTSAFQPVARDPDHDEDSRWRSSRMPNDDFEVVPRIEDLQTGIQMTRKHLKGVYIEKER